MIISYEIHKNIKQENDHYQTKKPLDSVNGTEFIRDGRKMGEKEPRDRGGGILTFW